MLDDIFTHESGQISNISDTKTDTLDTNYVLTTAENAGTMTSNVEIVNDWNKIPTREEL